MSRTYVALDLETTGLNPDKDAIIELGAVRFRDGEILDRFSQVVNPGRRIPPAIQQMTGISQAEADAAPPLSRVASAFRAFVGDAPVVGHNIGFDISFLRANGLYNYNPLIDTFELALITLPGLSSYKLGRVAERLGVSLENAHRAYDDAEASMWIFEAMRRLLVDEVPAKTLEQIVRMGQLADWSLTIVFEDALREQARRGLGQRQVQKTALDKGPLFRREQPLQPVEHPQPLDVDALAALLEPGGPFDAYFDLYEYREPQVAMLRAVADAFNRSRHLLIEAGTGTGKSLAYLIPALAWAVNTGQRVVVSSNTINLQDQLYHKDLPDLHHILPFDFKATVMKGRSNYLCPRRLNKLMARPDLTAVEVSVLARILLWLPHTETGDVSELTLVNAAERAVWQRVCSDPHTCSSARCGMDSPQPCYFYKARNRAEAAHLIIVNHALLLSDIATEGGVLPEYHHLIVDEAHHLEAAATNALTASVDHASFVTKLRELAPATGGEMPTAGLLADVVTAVRRADVPSDKADKITDYTRRLAAGIPALDMHMAEYMDALDRFLMQHFGRQYDNTMYDLRLRITKSVRVQPAWVDVEIIWDNLEFALNSFVSDLDHLIKTLGDLGNYPMPERDDLEAELTALWESVTEALSIGHELTLEPDANAIYWVRRSKFNGSLTLYRAPLHVGGIIEEHIFRSKDTVVLTSATLRTANSFDYIRGRLNAFEVEELALESPFDYKKNALVFIPTDMPEPNKPDYQAKVEEAILQLSLATQGRLMALFTSYAQLKDVAQRLRPLLEEAGFTLFVQGEGGSRQQILTAFRETEKAVILGTRSFWEGVDVQGEALSALVITKLPFSVPNDPIISARSETFDSPFYQYSVPEAILHLRQGFGRLIRSTSDRGVAVLLDKRLLSKRYGRLFLESLPDVTLCKAPLADLPEAAQRWLAGEGDDACPKRRVASSPPRQVEEPPPWLSQDGGLF